MGKRFLCENCEDLQLSRLRVQEQIKRSKRKKGKTE